MKNKKSGRVLCITSNYPRWRGDSTTPFVLHLAQDLQQEGWEVDVLAPHAPGAAYDEVIDGIPVRRFRYAWPVSAQTVCYNGGALVNLRRSRFTAIKLPMLVLAELLSVLAALRRGRHDAIHSHWILPQGFVGLLAARLTGTRHVLTVHGGDVFGLKGKVMAFFKRLALRGADVVTVNSSATERAVKDLVGEAARVRRVPMGIGVTEVDRARAAEIRAEHRRGDGPLLVFVGRLVEEKGVGDLIEAMVPLLQRFPGAVLMVLGEGPEKRHFKDLARDRGVAARVHFLGWVDSAEIGAYYAASDAFVGPSKEAPDGWIEAQGLTFAEAMMAGVPVVATRSGGIPDTVQHERTGLLVDPGAPDQIADAVTRLVRDPDLVARLTAAAVEYVRENLVRPKPAQRLGEMFRELGIGSPPGP